ncbi:MAG: hypothetical protein PHQ62_00980 [Clostridia bacterium]|nr:hypothetical protein [Clostridia bacterium]
MALSKKIQNLVIGLNTKDYTIKIMQNYGNDFKRVNIEQYVCDKTLIDNKKIFEILDSVLNIYLMDKTLDNPDVYIVLPDYFVGIDLVKIPIMPKNKMKDALKTELKKLYFNYKSLEINSTILTKTKKNYIYSNTIINKDIIRDCITATKKHNLNLKNISYDANCIVNSFLALGNKIKHSNHIILNISEKNSQLAYVSKDKTICFTSLPFGNNFLNSNQAESDFYQNTVAEFAVFNAKEQAKAKKSLIGAKNQEEIIDEFENRDFDNYYKNLQNTKKHFAKFLHSDFSEKNDLLKTNFITFIKHILLLKKSVVDNYSFPEPEYAIVNIATEFTSVFQTENEDKIKIKNFSKETIDKCSLTEYMDLYGMLYAVVFNRGQNFINKEKQGVIATLKMNIGFNARKIFKKISSLFKNTKKS